MKTVTDIINDVITTEGGYVNDPNDSGGETKYGITKATARANGYVGNMKDLPRDLAFEIYRKKYVVAPGFDKIVSMDLSIGAEMVDTGVNMGTSWAGKFLQRSLNALSGAGLVVDGAVGPRTITALAEYIAYRKAPGVKVLLKMLNSLQCSRYIELVESNQKNRSFIYGWVANRVEI